LAVLPLANLSGDPEQEYFADGMTEALITDLGKISSPRVISRQSIMQYKGSRKPLQEVAKELKVDAVLEGAVERSGDRVRVTVRLQRVSPESQVWANEYSRGIRDVMALEDEIARAVAGEIQARLTPEERTRLTSAESFTFKGGEENLRAGIAYFKKAIEKDPGYARAYAGLSWALWLSAVRGVQAPKDVLREARAAAEKAIALDPSLSDGHVSRALVLTTDWNWSEAEKEHRLALKLGPNSWGAHASYTEYLIMMGRFDEATAQINYASELEPMNPWNRGDLAIISLDSHKRPCY
jgi:TolB-like protein